MQKKINMGEREGGREGEGKSRLVQERRRDAGRGEGGGDGTGYVGRRCGTSVCVPVSWHESRRGYWELKRHEGRRGAGRRLGG